MRYWIFQGNPKQYDFEGAIRNDDLSIWSVKAHKEKIHQGDKIIFWLTGDNAGCYALGEVSSEVYKAKDSANEIKYYLNNSENKEEDRVKVSIDYNLIDNPVLKEEINEVQALGKLKVGHQGTKFFSFFG